VVQWLRDSLQIITTSGEVETLAGSVPDSGGVYMVPAFVGLGAPYWDSDARGAIFGLTRGATRAHIARAAVDSIAYQTRDVIEAMRKDSGLALESIRVDGGATRNGALLQFQADILGARVLATGGGGDHRARRRVPRGPRHRRLVRPGRHPEVVGPRSHVHPRDGRSKARVALRRMDRRGV
jgi:sugar (pentulose or hexulose) kinase